MLYASGSANGRSRLKADENRGLTPLDFRLDFVPKADSPTETPLLIASFEVSGTTVIFKVVE